MSIAVLIYNSAEAFSIFTTYISDLGAAAKSSSLVYNTGMIISAPIRVVFGLYLLKFLESKGADVKILKIIAYPIVIGAIGSVIMSVFPYDISRLLHLLGAFTYFFSAVIIQALIAKIEFKTSNMLKYLPLIGLIVVLTYVLFVSFEISVLLSNNFRMLACFFEWMGYFSLMAWLVLHGHYTLKSK